MEGRAALSVGVANRVRVGNERGSDGGEGRVADGAVKDALAAVGRDGVRWRRPPPPPPPPPPPRARSSSATRARAVGYRAVMAALGFRADASEPRAMMMATTRGPAVRNWNVKGWSRASTCTKACSWTRGDSGAGTPPKVASDGGSGEGEGARAGSAGEAKEGVAPEQL